MMNRTGGFVRVMQHIYDECREIRQMLIPAMALALCMGFTGALVGQSIVSQQTKDAIQDQQIMMLDKQENINSTKIDILTSQMFDVKASIDRLNGIGIGFGSLLSGLLAVQMFLQNRGRKQ